MVTVTILFHLLWQCVSAGIKVHQYDPVHMYIDCLWLMCVCVCVTAMCVCVCVQVLEFGEKGSDSVQAGASW